MRHTTITLLAAIVLLLSACPLGTADAAPLIPGEELFSSRAVRTFKIEIVGAELEALKKNNREYVHGTVREGTNSLTNVAVHLKGMGSFRPLNEKPSLAIRFDKYVPGQTYSG